MKNQSIQIFLSLLLVILFNSPSIFAQEGVGIGTDAVPTDAILNVVSPDNDKGILIPKLSTTQRDGIGASSEGLMIYNTSNKAYEFYSGSNWLPIGVPKGTILMWSGSVSTIPKGYAFCDGGNGTPNLRTKFIVGAQETGSFISGPFGGGYQPGQQGGEASVQLTTGQMPSHTHGVTDPGHSHGYKDKYQNDQISDNADDRNVADDSEKEDSRTTSSATTGITIQSAGGGEHHENRPPFYVLAFIMKL